MYQNLYFISMSLAFTIIFEYVQFFLNCPALGHIFKPHLCAASGLGATPFR